MAQPFEGFFCQQQPLLLLLLHLHLLLVVLHLLLGLLVPSVVQRLDYGEAFFQLGAEMFQ